MLKFKPYKPDIITNQFKLEFEGYYGDMDYDYNKEYLIEDTEQNRAVIEEVLKKLPDKPYGCSESQEFTEKINEILEKVEHEMVYIAMEDDWYPYWDLDIYYFDKNGNKFEVGLEE